MSVFRSWLPRDHEYPDNPFKRTRPKDWVKKKRRKRKAERASRRLHR